MTETTEQKIRYHDKTIRLPVHHDGSAADNWNPDAVYAENEYVDAHFRINTPAYQPPNYCFSEEDRQRFNEETAELFAEMGWTPENSGLSGGCMTYRKGKSSLYLHPQDFSGAVRKTEVKAITEALRRHRTFALECVDLYETLYDMTDEAYYAYLDTQIERIRAEILKSSVTTRRNKYYRDYDIANHVAAKVRLNRVGEDDGKHIGAGKTAQHIMGVIEQLIVEGRLVTEKSRNGSRLIRALNKMEERMSKKAKAA